jgi:hypothetical protein
MGEEKRMNQKRILEMVQREVATIRDTADLPSVPVGMEEDMVRLGHDSRDILGYQPLHKKAVLGGSRLANTLIELGIEVLSPTAILEYESKLGRPNRYLVTMVEQGMGVLDEVDDGADDEDDDDDDDDTDEANDERQARITNFEWYRTNIQDYSKPIPPHVLAKAIEIKKALPTTEFFVEELKAVPDPFLIASFGSKDYKEQYYIEVWEEPTFEKRATKDAPSKSSNRKQR